MKRLLIVEDNPSDALMLTEYFSKEDPDIVCDVTASPLVAIAKSAEKYFDPELNDMVPKYSAVTIDWRFNATESVTALCEYLNENKIPFFIITGCHKEFVKYKKCPVLSKDSMQDAVRFIIEIIRQPVTISCLSAILLHKIS